MKPRFADGQAVLHVLKHYLGRDPERERWDLVVEGPAVQRWDDARRAVLKANCRFERHGHRWCERSDECERAAASVQDDYLEAAWADLSTGWFSGLRLRTKRSRPGGGGSQPVLSTVGARGIRVDVYSDDLSDEDRDTLRTAYRVDITAPQVPAEVLDRPRRRALEHLCAGVASLRIEASARHPGTPEGCLSVDDLYRVETALRRYRGRLLRSEQLPEDPGDDEGARIALALLRAVP